ncbi:integrase core domain-containing protein [Pseudomonas sp. MT3]
MVRPWSYASGARSLFWFGLNEVAVLMVVSTKLCKTLAPSRQYSDLIQARRMACKAVDIYNQERPHLALKYKTPDAVHRAF